MGNMEKYISWNKDKDLTSKISMEECSFEFTRSSGAGGQNVNKVSTKARLRYDLANSRRFTDEEKERIRIFYPGRVTENGEFVIESQRYRSQVQNKRDVLERFLRYMNRALVPRKKREPTGCTKSSQEKRLEEKKKKSEKKAGRRKINF